MLGDEGLEQSIQTDVKRPNVFHIESADIQFLIPVYNMLEAALSPGMPAHSYQRMWNGYPSSNYGAIADPWSSSLPTTPIWECMTPL